MPQPTRQLSYEPGLTGADYMQRAGWHERDAYGNPLTSSAAASGSRQLGKTQSENTLRFRDPYAGSGRNDVFREDREG